MFGLMQPLQSCGTQDRRSRLHYCGTCKTLGLQHSHLARLGLNYDVVFLAELLTALSQEQTEAWAFGYQQINQCWTLPQATDIPSSLAFAADLNLVLIDLKIQDKLQDQAYLSFLKPWATWFRRPFRSALQAMQRRGLDASKFDYYLEQQNQCERAQSPSWELAAQATAQITRDLLLIGAQSLGLAPEVQSNLQALAFAFGQYIYLLDAWEDRKRDAKNKAYNPFLRAKLHETEMRQILLQVQSEVLAQAETLPLDTELKADFQARFLGRSMEKIYETQAQACASESPQKSQAKPLPASWQGTWQFLWTLAVFMVPQTSDWHFMAEEQRLEASVWALGALSFLGFGLGLGILLVPPVKRALSKETPPDGDYADNCYKALGCGECKPVAAAGTFCGKIISPCCDCCEKECCECRSANHCFAKHPGLLYFLLSLLVLGLIGAFLMAALTA